MVEHGHNHSQFRNAEPGRLIHHRRSGHRLARNGGTVSLVGALDNTGATLTLNGAAASWVLADGSITGGTIATSGGAALIGTAGPYSPAANGTLSGVTLAGTIDLTEGQRVGILVTGGLTLSNGTINLGGTGNSNWGYLQLSGTQTLGGTGTVNFGTDGTLNSGLGFRLGNNAHHLPRRHH